LPSALADGLKQKGYRGFSLQFSAHFRAKSVFGFAPRTYLRCLVWALPLFALVNAGWRFCRALWGRFKGKNILGLLPQKAAQGKGKQSKARAAFLQQNLGKW